ncbi:MAG: type II secretion system protein GspM [Desulfomonilia bacterium]
MQKIKLKIPIKVNTRKLKELALPVEQALGRALDYLATLSPRERLIVIGGTVFLVVFILLAGIIGPLVHYKSILEKSLASNDTQLKKIYALSANIKGLQAVASISAVSGNKQFTLFGYLEELAAQLRINDRIEYMKPITDTTEANRESVEVKIRGLYLEDLIGLLFGIENTPYPVKIKRLNLKKQEKDGNLDVTFQVISYG